MKKAEQRGLMRLLVGLAVLVGGYFLFLAPPMEAAAKGTEGGGGGGQAAPPKKGVGAVWEDLRNWYNRTFRPNKPKEGTKNR
jgi:hypothetical protein